MNDKQESKGTEMAREIREKCNLLTKEEKQNALISAIKLINKSEKLKELDNFTWEETKFGN